MSEKAKITNNFEFIVVAITMLFDVASLALMVAIVFKVVEGFIRIVSTSY